MALQRQLRAQSRVARLGLVLATLTYAVIPALYSLIGRSEVATARVTDFSAQQRRNSSAVATILGEFRTNLSDMLFIKTERYLHGGVAYMPHIDTDQLASSGEIATMKTSQQINTATGEGATTATAAADTRTTHTDEEHEVVATLIRTPENDFRGFLGTLERQVQPWRDPHVPHEHIGGVELLPWYRLATIADPTNVRAYMIGAWWLKTLGDDKALNEALKFLDEGIRHNPKAFQLYLMKGYILRQLGRKTDALKAFERAVEVMKGQRPPDGETGPRWTLYNEEDAIAACSTSVLQLRDTYEDDIQGLQAALDRVRKLRQEIQNMPALERLERSLKSQLDAKLQQSGQARTQ